MKKQIFLKTSWSERFIYLKNYLSVIFLDIINKITNFLIKNISHSKTYLIFSLIT